MHPQSSSPSGEYSHNQQRDSADYRAELERLLHTYEPGNEASATQLLEAYAGMEHELVECYRHYYAGKESFRVALDDNQESGSPRVSSPGPLHLPTSAIGTYLQAKLQSRRGGAKLEDVRGPTTADAERIESASTSSRRRPAAVVPRRRAISFSATLQHTEGLTSNREDEITARRASTSDYNQSEM